MAKEVQRSKNVDPAWPQGDGHPVTELAADRQGSLSPFGEVTFPVDDLPYVHPETEINWKQD
ncbi:hypothetical protein [Sciscionella marina]|uniref:hypothetical protein n=1 Tax=Sciscionella marina TaxID=508770 RepID=UPI00036EFDED|nr:hypothetical protein [Sciscionella marina]